MTPGTICFISGTAAANLQGLVVVALGVCECATCLSVAKRFGRIWAVDGSGLQAAPRHRYWLAPESCLTPIASPGSLPEYAATPSKRESSE